MLLEGLCRRQPGEGLARSAIQFVGNQVQVGLGELSQILSFAEILTKQTVGVFIAAPLPGAVRIAK